MLENLSETQGENLSNGAEIREKIKRDPLFLLEEIADISRVDGEKPKPNLGKDSLGREMYAFSEIEDAGFEFIEKKVRAVLEELKEGKDYRIKTDEIGNMFVTLLAKGKTDETMLSGSHIDCVEDGGKYDGVAGVNFAFNTLCALVDKKLETKEALKKNYTFAVFRGEESSPKTEMACVGSLFYSGQLTLKKLEKLQYKPEGKERISFEEHFKSEVERRNKKNKTNDNPQEKWDALVAEVKKRESVPEKEKENRLAHVKALEVHIEQSAVTEKQGNDLGIVTVGVGGARREKVNTEPGMVPIKKIEATPENPLVGYTIEFTGERAHTGGTPPNMAKTKNPKTPGHENMLYRKDALIASADFCRLLDRVIGNKFNFYITEVAAHQKVNFTTVPPKKRIQFCVEEKHQEEFEAWLMKLMHHVETTKHVTVEENEDKRCKLTEGSVNTLDKDVVFEWLHIISQAAYYTRREFRKFRANAAKIAKFTRGNEVEIQALLDAREAKIGEPERDKDGNIINEPSDDEKKELLWWKNDAIAKANRKIIESGGNVSQLRDFDHLEKEDALDVIGDLRVTLTDFDISNERYEETDTEKQRQEKDRKRGRVKFNIDYRSVDPDDPEVRDKVVAFMHRLIKDLCDKKEGKIDKNQKTMSPFNFDSIYNPKTVNIKQSQEDLEKKVGLKSPSQKDPAEINTDIVDDLIRHAKKQKYDVSFIPSLAGHDIGVCGKSGAKIGILFIKHDGVSHNNEEYMLTENYVKAQSVGQAYILEHVFQTQEHTETTKAQVLPKELPKEGDASLEIAIEPSRA